MANTPNTENPVFHQGEQMLQARAGKRDKMAAIGARVIRPYLPDQHREFYAQLPFLVAGGVAADGWPWASIISGAPGFVHSPNPTTLQIQQAAVQRLQQRQDPLGDALSGVGNPVGLLGIELATRRRNRVNGHIIAGSKCAIALHVDQAFGNCPKYIHARSVTYVLENAEHQETSEQHQAMPLTQLDTNAATLIAHADTFFVASYIPQTDSNSTCASEGVDVSHRGGKPGFVKVKNHTLTIPEFMGNFQFNTLGNFLINPKAGLVFLNFKTGELLLLTGTVELLQQHDPLIRDFKGAQHGWRFSFKKGLRMKNALGLKTGMPEYSPATAPTGSWHSSKTEL